MTAKFNMKVLDSKNCNFQLAHFCCLQNNFTAMGSKNWTAKICQFSLPTIQFYWMILLFLEDWENEQWL